MPPKLPQKRKKKKPSRAVEMAKTERMVTALKVLQMKLQRPEMRKMSFRTNKVLQRFLRSSRRLLIMLPTTR